ncbi:MAG TPA: glycosyltransferase family 4 protein [Polyangiales bacterium]|nr:glycosyltransferase family 4 protein [Polyangiales bacterium]
MRILMTADAIGGVFTYAVELSRALAAHGIEVVLATFGRPLSAAQRSQARRCPGLELHESSFALEWMPEPWADVHAAGMWLRRLARRLAPDLMHFNHYAQAALAWPAPALVVAHSDVWSWWRAVHGTTPGADWARYYACVHAGLHAADRVIAPSHAMLENLTRDYGPLPSAQVIPNGIELARFAPACKRPYVLAAGRLWDEAKNIAALEHVARSLEWPVYVAGESHSPQSRAPAGLADRASRAAFRPLGSLGRHALVQRLAHAAIYALPARYEPFGLSVLEGAASGCALVLGRIPSLLENWHDAALFVDPDDTAELSRTLTRLIRDRALREHWGARARQRAARLGAARMAGAYARTYAELCAARPAGSLACAS